MVSLEPIGAEKEINLSKIESELKDQKILMIKFLRKFLAEIELDESTGYRKACDPIFNSKIFKVQ